jgi:rSAM/selenodomain-associated transferase 1
MSTCARRDSAILVFARAPVPGAAKTRLIPRLGAQGAARLQERLTLDTLSTALDAGIGPVQLWCAPDTDHLFFSRCAKQFGLILHGQIGSTLGDRMAHAVEFALPQHAAVILVGTDCPALTCQHLRAAAMDLGTHDAVIVPAEDGGYVLLGLARPIPQAFRGVDWGGPRVFEQTMHAIARATDKVAVHKPLWDVDLPADYARLQAMWAAGGRPL